MKRIISLFLSLITFISVFMLFDANAFCQVTSGIASSVFNIQNDLVSTHDECNHDYYVKSVTGTPNCSKKGLITYECKLCGKTNRVYEAYGHMFIPESIDGKVITYKCNVCNYVSSKIADYPLGLFDSNVNRKTLRGNDNCYIDVVNDGVINAKDYAYLKKLSKITLSNPNVNEKTKRIYNYLCEINGTKTLSAQQESTWMGSVDYEIDYVYENTGKYPAMRGLDYMNDDFKGVNSRAIAYAKKGGLVTICWHTGADFIGEWKDAQEDTVSDWNAMLTPGTKEYNNMIAGMDKAAKALKELQDAGVTVLWRPFHEFDGGWFWWGKNGAEPFKTMWEIMYDRYTNYWGLNNLIWVLGFSHNGVDIANWKPSEMTYDIIGADTYDNENELAKLYKEVAKINVSNKPIVLHECGTNPNENDLTLYPWCYFMTWHSEYITDYNDKNQLKTLYNSDKVITLDELNY